MKRLIHWLSVHKSAVPVLLALAVMTWGAPYSAWAFSSGVSGKSGKTGTYCSQCHSGGTTPTVSISGPTSLETNTSAVYTFTINNGPAQVAGLDVAVSSGTLEATDPNTKLLSSEVTHSNQPLAFSGSSAAFTFTYHAPSSAGTYTIYAAGVSANNNGSQSGDGAADTTLSVIVSAPAPTNEPQITVWDSVAPHNDLQIPFGSVDTSLSSDQTVTVTNTGGVTLNINQITSLADPFLIELDNCSNQALAPAASCTLTIEFAPTTAGPASDSFDIPSNDPATPTVTVSVSGNGVLNLPPTKPLLISPTDGSTGVGTSPTLKWTKSTDPDGDTVSYHLYVDTDSAFTSTVPIDLAGRATGIYFAGTGLLFFGFVLGRRGRSRALVLMLMMASLLAIGSLTACSSKNSTALLLPSTTKSYQVTGLASGTVYYWKVVADDGRGGLTASNIQSFTTQ